MLCATLVCSHCANFAPASTTDPTCRVCIELGAAAKEFRYDTPTVDIDCGAINIRAIPRCYGEKKAEGRATGVVDEPALALFLPEGRKTLLVRFGFKSLEQVERETEQRGGKR